MLLFHEFFSLSFNNFFLSLNSMDDCIEDLDEPLYGFTANITLIDDEPCILGDTCDSFALGSICTDMGNLIRTLIVL